MGDGGVEKDLVCGEVGAVHDPSNTERNDFALVIGVNHYPAHQGHDLNGAINDAYAFRDWLVDNCGGGLDPDRIRLVESTGQPDQPVQKHIDDKLEQLLLTADAEKGGGRLYVFFSGHGAGAMTARDNVALLLTDWSRRRERLALSTRSYANDLVAFGLFHELVIFVDCCRSEATPVVGIGSQITNLGNLNSGADTHTLFAYATGANTPAKERIHNNRWCGVFTTQLVNILSRGHNGILAASLKDLLEREVPIVEPGQGAHVENGLKAGARFGSGRVGPQLALRVRFRPGIRGVVQLLDGYQTPICSHEAAEDPWIVLEPLTVGHLYKVVHVPSGDSVTVDFGKQIEVTL